LATLDVIESEGLIENARAVGDYIRSAVTAMGDAKVAGVEGRGLLLGLRLRRPAADVQRALFGHRVLTGTATDPAILRLIPPLGFSHREADLLLAALGEVLA
jgi:acetylornithine aminotransferase